MNEMDFFTPDDIDQQIDQLSQLVTKAVSDHHGVQLIATLHHIYQREQEHGSVERVKQRLASRENTLFSASDSQSPRINLRYSNTRRSHVAKYMAHQTIAPPRTLSIIAAVLIVSLIISSWIVVTRLAPPRPGTTLVSQNKNPDNIYSAGKQIIYKLKGSTGAVVWQQKLSTGGSISIKTLDGMIYAFQFRDIYALNPRDGTVRWHKHSTTDAYVTMIAQDGTLYLSGNYQPDKRHISTLFLALNARDGSERWRNTTINSAYREWFTVQDGAIYVKTTNKDGLYAIDAAMGTLRWRSHEKFDAPGFDDTPLVADGIVYDFDGNYLYALDEKSGGQLWHQQITSDRTFFSAKFYNGVFYIGSRLFRQQYQGQYEYGELVHAFAAQTGAPLWTSPIGYKLLDKVPVTESLIFAERNYQGTRTISALDARSGKVRWQFTDSCPPPQCFTDWAAVSDGLLYLFESKVTNQDMKESVIAFDVRSGKNLFRHPGLGPSYTGAGTQPSHDMTYLIVVTPDQPNNPNSTNTIRLYAYQLSSGVVRWQYTLSKMGEADFYANDYGPVVGP